MLRHLFRKLKYYRRHCLKHFLFCFLNYDLYKKNYITKITISLSIKFLKTFMMSNEEGILFCKEWDSKVDYLEVWCCTFRAGVKLWWFFFCQWINKDQYTGVSAIIISLVVLTQWYSCFFLWVEQYFMLILIKMFSQVKLLLKYHQKLFFSLDAFILLLHFRGDWKLPTYMYRITCIYNVR